MLRILYIVCDVMAALFAVISPVAIFHWLLRAVNIVGLKPFLQPFTYFFTPLNAFVEIFWQPPAIHYNGHVVSTTQGIVACLFTLTFLGLNVLSEYLKTTEQQLDVSRQSELQRNRLRRLQAVQEHRQKKVSTNRRFLVQVNYEFDQCPAGSQLLEQALARQAGKPLERQSVHMTLEFSALTQAMQYCMAVSQSLLNYYAMLRPKDPQPPFKMGIHAIDAALPTVEAMAEMKHLVAFAGLNSVVFSQTVRDVLEADGQSLTYNFQSMGFYGLGQNQQEVFKLFNAKPKASF